LLYPKLAKILIKPKVSERPQIRLENKMSPTTWNPKKRDRTRLWPLHSLSIAGGRSTIASPSACAASRRAKVPTVREYSEGQQ